MSISLSLYIYICTEGPDDASVRIAFTWIEGSRHLSVGCVSVPMQESELLGAARLIAANLCDLNSSPWIPSTPDHVHTAMKLYRCCLFSSLLDTNIVPLSPHIVEEY
jgi:hypothetical protein